MWRVRLRIQGLGLVQGSVLVGQCCRDQARHRGGSEAAIVVGVWPGRRCDGHDVVLIVVFRGSHGVVVVVAAVEQDDHVLDELAGPPPFGLVDLPEGDWHCSRVTTHGGRIVVPARWGGIGDASDDE